MNFVRFEVVYETDERYELDENCMYLADKFDRMCEKLDSKFETASFSGMTFAPKFTMIFYTQKKNSGVIMKYISNNLGGKIKEIRVVFEEKNE